jgi:hypothetical protein
MLKEILNGFGTKNKDGNPDQSFNQKENEPCYSHTFHPYFKLAPPLMGNGALKRLIFTFIQGVHTEVNMGQRNKLLFSITANK